MSRARRNIASLMHLWLVAALALEFLVIHFPTPSGVAQSPEAASSVRDAWTVAGELGHAGARFVPDALDPILDDKAVHLGLYLALALLWAGARQLGGRLSGRGAAFVFMALSGYAAIGEAAQSFGGRIPEFMDWVANVVGAALGVALVATGSRLIPAHAREPRGRSSSLNETPDPW